MTYKYVSKGMNLGGSGAGRISWFHDDCVRRMTIVAGGNPGFTTEQPPKGTKCYSCGKEIEVCPKCGSEIDERMWYLADDSEGIRRKFVDCVVCGRSVKLKDGEK